MDTYNVNNLESFHFNIGVLHAREHASHTNLLSWCKVNKAANGNVWLKLVSPKWIMLKPSLCKIICTLKLNLLFTLALYFLFRCLISPKNSIDCYKFLSSQSVIFYLFVVVFNLPTSALNLKINKTTFAPQIIFSPNFLLYSLFKILLNKCWIY